MNNRSSEELFINLKLKMLTALFSIWFFIFRVPNSSCLFNDTIAAGKLLHKVLAELDGMPPIETRRRTYPEAIKRLQKFREDFRGLHQYVLPSSDPLRVYSTDESMELKIYLEDAEIDTTHSYINDSFSNFREFLDKGRRCDPARKDKINSFPLNSESYLESLRSIITPLQIIKFWNDGYFSLIATMKSNDTQCGQDHKIQNLLITSYKAAVLTEIKAHMILALSYAYQHGPLASSDLGYIDSRRRQLAQSLSRHLFAYSSALSSSLKAMSLSYFRYCDPSYNSWIQDVSFFELNGFLQEVIFRYETPFCSASCMAIWHEHACRREWIDKRTSCNGRVTSCAWLGDVKACALANGPRKYQWVQSSQLGMLGNNSASCPESQGYHIGTEQRVAYNPESGCHCDCLENQWKVYLGSLESRESDNYVITGVRFKLKDNILFLQPAQGKLHPNGYIADYEWINLPRFIQSIHVANINLNYGSFFLDDLQLAPGHALTGIRFRAVRRGSNTPIGGFDISISGRPLDYKTGKLDLTPANKNVVTASRSSIEKQLIYKRVRPMHAEIFERLEPSSNFFTYLTLQQSVLTHDFGQSTLPLFDSTPVVMKRHSPLAGIAIFHKGSKDNSGFISVQVRPISYLPYLGDLMWTYKEMQRCCIVRN